MNLSKRYFLMLLSAALINSAAFAASEKPNILFIFLDDFGWKDTSYMGSDFYESPNIDKLASEGMVFTKAYSASANCAPARACMLSGQYTPRHEIYNVGTGLRGNPKHSRLKHIPGVDTLDTSIRTWAQQIQASGYETAMMGKWHLSDDPIPYGFDVNVGGTHSGSPPRGYYPPHPNIPSLQGLPEDSYLTDYLSDQADAFIRSNKDNPWMLYLTHFAVHTPLDAKKELVAKYEAKAKGELHDHVEMATMIQSVDDGIGKIQATLDELGLTDNTIVLFFSDNGGYGPATDMDPLKGYKGTYYEGGIRVPFFVKWPGVVAPGQKSSEPIIGVDVFPTLCEMTGAALPNGQDLDGVSLVSLFKGETPNLGNRALYWHFPAYLQSYAVTDEQRDILFRSRPCSVIRVGDWKLHQYFEDGGLELYNLRDDIGETRNLAKSMNEKTSELLARLEGWREGIGAPVPNERNPQFDAFAEAEGLRGRVKTRK
ncbi:MAG: sulfatase [Opitutales bacterium]|jgi:arylsulfatase A-like enzyme|nr:sulfatase [Opitutales bacterium]